ncbi:MAG TPA: methyltransferase domain-containing protein [Hydrogenophaga sp.]|uniref:class I SAM-dependent methyltransferase n=1 Tax=Hydrogenophaga sp. TaxID=1904254 RepID=UPI002B8F0816|nr:methyltransferase domain-containing protein [Hydrogenophaga sp.]HMN94600.1 methyltransferase domain-containing protein [Hydrogenophaga sp.]
MPTPPPQNPLSIERYRRHASRYDASAGRTMALRRRTIGLLRLQQGQVVLDAGAGTGLSYALLREAVGPQGQVLAFEQSPDMFALAQARVRREGWANIWQINGSAETVQLPRTADAVLFNYTHDICRSPAAVANVLRQVRTGGRVALAGMKFFPWWTGPLNLLVWLKNRPYSLGAADLWEPWRVVAQHCDDFEWTSTQWGMGYIACGVKKDRPA